MSNRACTIDRMHERIIAYRAALRATCSHARTLLVDSYVY
jgi:hypothetical protein